jgi:hypothetical protein
MDGSSASSQTIRENAIFILNLNKFKNHTSVYTVGDLQYYDATDYNIQAQTASITPDQTGDVWVVGFHIWDMNGVPVNHKTRMQIDNADNPSGQTTDARLLNNSWDSTDELIFQIQTVTSLDDSAHTIDLDGNTLSNNSNRRVEDRHIFAVTMELDAVPAVPFSQGMVF